MHESVITRKTAQRNLFVIWFVFSLILSVIFFGQTVVGNKYPGQSDEVWDWFIPLVFPTLTLMVGVLMATPTLPDTDPPKIDTFYYRLAIGAFVIYFLFILAVVLTAPLDYVNDEIPALDHLKKSTKLLNLLQGLVTAVLGFFFFKEK